MVFPLAPFTLAHRATISGKVILSEAVKTTTGASQNLLTVIQVRHRTTIRWGMSLLTEGTNWRSWGIGDKGRGRRSTLIVYTTWGL